MRAEVLLLVGAVAAAAIAWATLRDDDHDQQRRITKKKRRSTASDRVYHRAMQEHEYTALIPKHELLQLHSLLDAVYSARGWPATRTHLSSAWDTLLTQATSLEHHAWQPHLPMDSMQPDRLHGLASMIDTIFLGGQLQGWLEQQGGQVVRFQPVSQALGPDDWFANFFPQQNTIALRRGKWAEDALVITAQRPADYEGIQCTCRLQVLVHTLAHEMVHALVYHRLPAIDSSSPAYLADDRHGPVFRLLSLKLFGHATEEFRRR